MFIIKLVPVLLFCSNTISSSDFSNDAYKQILNANRAVREVYKYNHPPVDQQQSIPVAIVFDDAASREGKSIDDKVSKLNQNLPLSTDPRENKSPNLIKLTSDFSTKSTTVDTIKVSPATITEENLQIPVAVIYEPEPTTVRNRKKVLRRNKDQNQSQRLHVQKDDPKVLENKQSTGKALEKTTDISTSTQKANEQVTMAVHQENLQNNRKRPVVPIVQSENKVFGHSGDFHYSYEGGDGTIAFETGELKSFEDDKTGEAVVGGFSYTDKDGQDFSLSYTADENGYRPVGAHLPTPPPIPPAIERALRYLATKTTPEPVTDSVVASKDESLKT